MNWKKNIIKLLALAGTALAVTGQAATYYVDSVSGSDANSGTSSNAAWQTLAKINSTILAAGDTLLLKNGSSWSGTMNPKGSGSSAGSIRLATYGTNSARPVISGNGATDALVLTNQQYWEIANLEVINPGSGTSTERRGMHLCAANFGTVNHLYVSNCYVHGVSGRVDTSNSDTVAKRSGGIIVEVISDAGTATAFNDVLIQNCTITAVTNQGIVACGNRSGGSDYPGTDAWNSRKCSRIVIRNNVVSDIGKNAMSLRYADESCLVEHNLVHDTANATDGNMICSYGCRGTVFQYNEGYHNNGDGLHDGSLYDADLRSPKTVWQYSYSHDNSWGLFCQYSSSDTNGDAFGDDTHVVVRYNVSQNDQGSVFALSGDASGVTAGEYFYNNVIYTSNGLAPVFFDDRSGGHTYYSYNNVFYNLSTNATFNFHSYNTAVFAHNVFYGRHVSGEPDDDDKLTNDPAWVAPGGGGGAGGTNNLATLGCYKLQTGSPCIDSGFTVTSNLTGNTNGLAVDFFGAAMPVGSAPDRGVSEWTSVPALTLLAPTVLPNSAGLRVAANPGDLATSCYFAFGATPSYGAFTATNLVPPGASAVSVSNAIAGLLPGTVYHYRAYAANTAGVTNSADSTFTTTAVAAPMLVTGVASGGGLQFTFTNTPGASFSILAATNVAQLRGSWTLLGAAVEISTGQFQFSAGVTSAPMRFYQVRSP